jgi:hypothetical protein
LIVYIRDYVFSGNADSKFEVVAPALAGYIDANYHSIKRDGKMDLVLRNNLTIKTPAESLSDLSCPVAGN